MQAFIQSRYAPDSYSYPTLEELVLDGCKLKSISSDDFQFLSTFQNLVSLSVTCTGLTSLSGFPSFPLLKKLELQDNFLTSGSNSGLDQLALIAPNVRVLRLGGNKIKSEEELIQYLKPLKSLEVLDVDKNLFVTDKPHTDWRPYFFAELPQLKSVDGCDVSGRVVEDDDDDDDEDEYSEEEEDEEDANTLKAFYEKDFGNEEDDEDHDDFNPINVEQEDEDFDENEGLEDDDDEGDENVGQNGSLHKRSMPDSTEQENEEIGKKQRF